MKVLVIGPSAERSRGGMATVIGGIAHSRVLNEQFEIDTFSSYIDGNLVTRLAYSVWAYIRFLLCFRKYDVFHIHVASAGSTFRKMHYLRAIKRAGKKAIVHIHGARYMVFYNGLNEKRKQQVVRFLQSADTVLALSEDWKKQFCEAFGLTNCRVLHNGIDPEDYSAALSDADTCCKNFVLLGRMGKRKGVYDLLDAMAEAVRRDPELHLFLAGDGEVEQVRSRIRELGLEDHVTAAGWVDQAGKLALLAKCGTLVLPSYHEGLPMSVLEGMAAGKAVITTDVGGIPEVVGEKNGVLLQPGDTAALADALVRFAAEPRMLDAMGETSRGLIRRQFSMTAMHNRLAEYYRELES